MLVASVAITEGKHRHHQHDGVGKFAEHHDRVPFGRPVDHRRRTGHRHADEREQGHGGRQAQGLAQHLVALRIGVAAEVGDVQRQRGPEAHVRRQGREEERPELPRLAARRQRIPTAWPASAQTRPPRNTPTPTAPAPARSTAGP